MKAAALRTKIKGNVLAGHTHAAALAAEGHIGAR
eukprot:CAMPEP_0170649102 /NCGR_PEP_ID=MMETSP0224-20130122/45098_1 /TAXON_ID=285029 /ORGANISM="Togula jolla, Strain CCCM 725" /LENGTH=33 /DNA_ID= /DNA_START= /DNA_END= /DNA_ORIENTATION=